MNRFLAALQFLTILPISGTTAPSSQAAVFFPLIGALLGASAGAIFLGSDVLFGRSLASLLTITWLIVVSGCLHEDGLADVADAFRAGRSHEKILSILKDSRIGAYGAIALILSILFRWQALSQVKINPFYGLIVALTLSRTSMVVLAAITPPTGEGLGREFVNGIGRNAAFAAILQAAIVAFLVEWRNALALILSTVAIVLLARAYFMRRLGGVNGDCLGATCQMVETLNLLLLTWRYSS